jgi:abequosyltransferase
MQPEQPLLTIAIPTYNRSSLLRQLLQNLKDELVNEPRVELLISNNASTDDTKDVVEDLCREGLVAKRIHNETNIGADGNFLQCFQEATGKYLWLFSDDDVIVPGGVRKILAHISEADYDLVYVNSYAFADGGRAFPASRKAKPPEVFGSTTKFAARVHVFFTFISGNIVNRNKILSSGPHAFSQLVGTNLVQLGWTYAALRGRSKNLFIHERLVGNRADNTGGYGLCQIFGVNLQKITREWLADPTLERVIMSGVLRRFLPPYLYSFRKRNGKMRFKTEDPHKVLSPTLGKNFRYWLFDYPVIVMPRGMARAWLLLGRVINKIDQTLRVPLLR